MSVGDIIIPDNTITPEIMQQIAAAVNDLLSTTAKDPGQYEEVQSLTGISSLPVFQVGNTYKLVRVAVSVLKGVDGREVSLQVTKDYIQWRYTDGNWQNLIAIADLKGAAGETPVFRTGSSGIEWKYVSEPDTAYRSLVSYDVLKLKFSDLTTEQIQEFWEAIPADLITLFQKPATDAAAEVRNEMAQISEAASIAIKAANDAATNANNAAENVQDGVDGKTPILESVSAISGETPSGSFSQVGVDDSGNPKYILNLTLPKGKDGQPAVFEAGTTTTLAPSAEASVEVVPNGETPNGNPKYILNFFIPRGETGLPGAGSGNVSAEGAGLIAGKKYFFVPDASDSTSGRFVEYVDGPESGIDADLLDGKQGSEYLLATDADRKFLPLTGGTVTGNMQVKGNLQINSSPESGNSWVQSLSQVNMFDDKKNVIGFLNYLDLFIIHFFDSNNIQKALRFENGSQIAYQYADSIYRIYHQGNQGAGSGLDADLLDGKQGSEYALKTEIPDTIPDAPADGKTYGRKNEAWAEIKDGVYVLDLDAIVGDSPSGPITQEQYNSVAEAYNKHSTKLKHEGLYMNCSILLLNDEYLLIISDTAPLFGYPGEGISLSYLFITINSSSYSAIDRSISFRGPNGAGLGTKFLSDNGEYLTPPTATSTTAGYMSSSDKQRLDSALVLKNVTTASTLSNLSIANYSIKVTLSAASALSFASTPAEGWECMIDIKNSSASNITQPLPNASDWQCDNTSITIAAGKIASISVRYIHGTYVVIAKGN